MTAIPCVRSLETRSFPINSPIYKLRSRRELLGGWRSTENPCLRLTSDAPPRYLEILSASALIIGVLNLERSELNAFTEIVTSEHIGR